MRPKMDNENLEDFQRVFCLQLVEFFVYCT